MSTPEAAPAADPHAPPRNVVEALCRVMADLPGIGRTEQSEQGYSYRGIENITRHAQGLLAKHGVVFVPKVLERHVKDFTINSRPWTEDQAWVLYTVYGPGGVEDRIEVGPLVGLGRDNSDKGMNKALTQAFKYALIQTLCIGDAKDDPDADVAREADAHVAPVDPDKHARQLAAARVRELAPELRDKVRAYCDEHDFGRVAARWDDDQLEAVTEFLDGLLLAAAQEAAAEAPQAAVAAPQPPAAPDTADGAEQAAGGPTAADAAPVEWPPLTEAEVQVVIDHVKAMSADALKAGLAVHKLGAAGSDDAKRERLARHLVDLRWQPGRLPADPGAADPAEA